MNYKTKLQDIRAMVFDVDGVLTDGKIMLMPDGSMTRSMNVHDGYAMQLALKKGIHIGIITGGRDPQVVERLKKLGITDIYLGSSYKKEDFEDFLYKFNLKADQVLYMGDDIPDIEVMEMSGLACAPQDARPENRDIADYISPINGGAGCVRDIIEQLLKVQGLWMNDQKIQST